VYKRQPDSRSPMLVWRSVQDTFLLRVPETFDALLAGMTARSRQTLKRKVRKAQAKLPEMRCQCYREPGQMPMLAGRLRRVWEQSWHGRLGRQPPPTEQVLTRLAGLGAVRAYVLEAGNAEPLASVLGYQWKGTFYDEAPAFDEKWKDLSPGVVLDYLMLQDLVVHDRPRVIDFGFGYNQYKQVFGNIRETRGQMWIPLTSRGRRVTRIGRVTDLLFRLGKRVLGRTGLVRRLKAKLRSGPTGK
ncbi:MAG: GNAT family N-acetyltransferase, partial [Kiritimatiellae bacterium]|nr:GNAT family N-acetyltransferase [Kiritimatiellia bacterium]